MNVLALDVATCCGWAEGAGLLPRFGDVRLKKPDDPPDVAVGNIACWMRDRLSTFKPDCIVIEAPLNPVASLTRGNSYGTSTMLLQMIGAVKGVAKCYGVPWKEAHVQSVRKAFVGHGRPENPKRAVMEQCRSMGCNVRTDNEADAVALWFWRRGYIFGELAFAGEL